MRLALMLAVVALGAGVVAAPRSLTTAVPGIGTLHSVASLLDCDAHAIAQIGASPSSVHAGECTSAARQVATNANGGGR